MYTRGATLVNQQISRHPPWTHPHQRPHRWRLQRRRQQSGAGGGVVKPNMLTAQSCSKWWMVGECGWVVESSRCTPARPGCPQKPCFHRTQSATHATHPRRWQSSDEAPGWRRRKAQGEPLERVGGWLKGSNGRWRWGKAGRHTKIKRSALAENRTRVWSVARTYATTIPLVL